MSISEREMDILTKAYDDAVELRESHLVLSFQTRNQLLTSQFQFFLSLSSVVLAFQAILAATELVQINQFFKLSIVLSASLLVYTVTFVREQIDNQDKGLNDGETAMDRVFVKTRIAIKEAIEKDDFSIWKNHLATFKSKKNEGEVKPLNYSAEISVFLFTNSMFFGILSFSSFSVQPNYYIYVAVPLFSLLVAVADWNTLITTKISGLLEKVLRK